MPLREITTADIPVDGQRIADAVNAWITAAPGTYPTETPTVTSAQVGEWLGNQRVFLYDGAAGVIRGLFICDERSDYPDAAEGAVAPALRVSFIGMDPSLSSAQLRTALDDLKAWVRNNRPLLARLVGEVREDSVFWGYASARGYRVLRRLEYQDGVTLLIDRAVTGTVG